MTEKSQAAPQTAEDIAAIVRMQMRREIDAFRARKYWWNTLYDTPTATVVEGLVMALSLDDNRPQAMTVNVSIAPGVDVSEAAARIAALIAERSQSGGV